jgi:hypothetical protein
MDAKEILRGNIKKAMLGPLNFDVGRHKKILHDVM